MAAAMLSIVTSQVHGVPLREGIDYTDVKPAQPTNPTPGKVEVIEFFGYWCHFCNDFEPTMADWAKRNEQKVSTVFVPISFSPAQAPLQKLFYTLDALGLERQLRRKVFAAVHVDRSLPASPDADTMVAWAEKNGIDRKRFVDAMNSFAVQTRINRANQIAQAYGVTGVPALGIDGRYLASIQARTIGNADTLLDRALGAK